MIPDWPLYIPLGPAYEVTHSFQGVFTASLPLGLAVVLLFQYILKRPLYELLPMGVRVRLNTQLESKLELGVRTIAALCFAIVFGALTHNVWDAFTHGGSWGVAMHPELRNIWVTVSGVKFPGYIALQHASSIMGLPLLLILFGIWYARADQGSDAARIISPTGRAVWSAAILGVPLLLTGSYVWESGGTALRPVVRALYYGVTHGGFAFCLLVLGYTAFFYVVGKRRMRRRSGGGSRES